MGYTTDFDGNLTLSRTLTEEEKTYLDNFSRTRRMKRDVTTLQEHYQGKHSLNGDYGNEGEYFVDDERIGVICPNTPPGQVPYNDKTFDNRWEENSRRIKKEICQPGLWCQWIISDDGTKLEWDGNEKFYNYTEWLLVINNKVYVNTTVKEIRKIKLENIEKL